MAITKILNIQEAGEGNPAAHLKNALSYIQNPDKTEECILVGSLNCLPEDAYEQMLETKQTFHKTGKRQGYHVIISFSPEEQATAEQAMEVAANFAREVLGDDYEAVYAVHTDKEHMHAHLIWNSVSLVTGKKYNSPKENWKKHLQPITNKYCKKLGLGICPAEYSKHPVNMTRKEWQKEQEYKEFILRDAKFCALSAGSVEHFKFLMRRLGYEFQRGKYLCVRMPGRKLYHSLESMDEMFKEDELKHWVNMPWSANPHFFTHNPRKMYRAGMTDFQKRYYAKMYRMRVVEHKRFDYSSAKYAEELRKFHRLQDEYRLIVDNDIKSLFELLEFIGTKKQEIQSIDDQQHDIYKENQRRKRRIKTEKDLREYQIWRVSVAPELEKLKAEKKRAKKELRLADDTLEESVYSVQARGLEEETVTDADIVAVPEYEPENPEEKQGILEPEKVSEKKQGISEPEKMPVEKQGISAPEKMLEEKQEIAELEKMPEEEKVYHPQPTEPVLETEYEKADKYIQEIPAEPCESEPRLFSGSYQEYLSLPVERRIELHGIRDSDMYDDFFAIVKNNFERAGYGTYSGEIYDEAIAIKQYFEARKDTGKVAEIVDKFQKLKVYGEYNRFSAEIKAEIFGFDVNYASRNLQLYMQVMKALDVKMSQDEMFEDYQAIYDETVRTQEQKDKQRSKGRAR